MKAGSGTRRHNGGGAFDFVAVGTSRYQEALEDLAGGKVAGGRRLRRAADLVPEPENRHSKTAVAVYIEGHKVGYIPEAWSGRVSSALAGQRVAVDAQIIGGWREADGDEGNFGVRLDLDPEMLARGSTRPVAADGAARCAACGGVVAPGARVCLHCGRRLTGGSPAWLLVLVGVVAVVVIAGLMGREDQGAAEAPAAPAAPAAAIEQVGYFKSPARDRVMSFHSESRLSLEQVCKLWRGLPYTAGTLFRGVAYSGGNPAPADALSLAADLRRALEVTAVPPFDKPDWMFVVNPAGQRSFVGSEARCDWW